MVMIVCPIGKVPSVRPTENVSSSSNILSSIISTEIHENSPTAELTSKLKVVVF